MFSEFGEYDCEREPDAIKRLYVWQTAIGLQAVDGLKTSDFLRNTAQRNIAGDISIDEARSLIHQYYENRDQHAQPANEQEADIVSGNIAKLLEEDSFRLIPSMISEIHKRIFEGVFPFAGQFRSINIAKKEWVLRDESVIYTPAPLIADSLAWDIQQELKYDYDSLTLEQAVEHIAAFISGIWQIHPFAEGNTRTTAVFLIKYLRFMGFEADNSPFMHHSWYFRNALVRANYRNTHAQIKKTPTFLIKFLRNLILGEQHELKKRDLLIPVVQDADTQAEPTKTQKNSEPCKQYPDTVQMLIRLMGIQPYSLRQLMELCRIKHRPSFIENYIKPALSCGIIRLLHKEKPNHPRQKYLLTIKGQLLHNS